MLEVADGEGVVLERDVGDIIAEGEGVDWSEELSP